MPMTVYDSLIVNNCTVDHHESDLYTRVDDVSRSIVRNAIGNGTLLPTSVSFFRSAIDGTLNYELAFEYAPFWRKSANA